MKLYLFAIGGTGSRVLKSLIMLLASGVKINADEIIPVIIDLDKNNGNLKETIDLINLYKQVHSSTKSGNSEEGFFHTKITLPDSVPAHNLNLNITLDGKEDDNETLNEFIAYDSLITSDNKYIVDLLYSKKNREDKLSIGFKGQPHIGAVTFYSITKLQGFTSLCSNLQPTDRVFFVSSIFGGTGASGFPTMLKILRDEENNLPNSQYRRQVKIGGLIMLPYFSLEEKAEGEYINSDLFMTKTKLALTYYHDHLDGYEALYYLTEPSRTRKLSNSLGNESQKNPAHYIELMGALSILNFMEQEDKAFERDENGKRVPKYFEFNSIGDSLNDLDFSNIEEDLDQKQVLFKNKLSRFTYIYKYLHPSAKNPYYLNQDWMKKSLPEFFSRHFYKEIFSPFMESYFSWLKEMSDYAPKFSPFNLDIDDKQIGNLVKNYPVTKTKGNYFNSMNAIHFSFFDTMLNNLYIDKKYADMNSEERFVHLFQDASSELFKRESNLKN